MEVDVARKHRAIENRRRERDAEAALSVAERADQLTARTLQPNPDRLGRSRALGAHEWRAAGSLARANLRVARPSAPEPAAAPGPAPSTP